jgi:O-antigen ligase
MRERLDKWCERGILAVVLAILVFAPLATGAVRPLERLVLQGLMIGLILLWLPRFWLRENYRLLFPPLAWVVLAFTGYAVYRYFTADLEYIARQELLKVVVYAVLFFAVVDNLHRQETTQWVVLTLVFLAMLLSMYAVYQFTTKSPYVWNFIKPAQYLRRGSGTFICPNHLAGYLEMILPLGLAATFMGRFSPALKVFVGYASLVTIAGIVVSLSRGGWIATGISLFLFFLLLVKNRRFRIPALVLLAMVLLAGIVFANKSYNPQKRFQRMFEDGKVRDVRFRLWQPAWEMWQDHVWVGTGPGHFDYRFREYRPFDIQMRPLHAHNDYLTTLADWGVVGAVLVAAALVCVYAGVFKTWKFVQRSNDLTTKSSNRSAYVLGGAIGLFALLLHCIVDFNMQIPAIALTAATVMAVLTAHLRFATDRYWINPGMAGKLTWTLLCLGAVAFLGYHEIRGWREYSLLAKAAEVRRDPAKFETYIELLKRAHAVEPANFETTQTIGEMLRAKSFQGYPGYRKLAEEAIEWFQRGVKLNPYDSTRTTAAIMWVWECPWIG